MDIASLGLEVRSDGVVVASDRLNRFGQDADRAEGSVNRLSSAFRLLAPVVGLVMAAFNTRALTQYADQWSDLSARVGNAVGSMDAAPAVLARIEQTARMTYSSLDLTAEGFIRNSRVLSELGKTTQQQLDYQEALNNALVVSGARGRNAEFVQESLNRSMALGDRYECLDRR